MSGRTSPPEYHRALARWQRVTPVVGFVGTTWGIARAFQRVSASTDSLPYGISLTSALEAFAVGALVGSIAWLALLLAERE